MSTPTEDRHKSRPITFRLDDEHRKLLDAEMQKLKQTQTQTLNFIMDTYFLSGLHGCTERTPEKCRSCLKCAGEVEKGVVCLTKKDVGSPIHYRIVPFAVAQKCAEIPFNTPLDKKTREQYEKELQSAREDIERESRLHDTYRKKYDKLKDFPEDYAKLRRELDQVKQPYQDLLNKKGGLEMQLTNMHNSLLKALEEKDILQTDNEFLRTENMKLSENELLKQNKEILDENDSLHLQLKQASNEKADIAEEVLKVQALLKEERNQKSDIISRSDKMLREIEQYMPLPRSQLSVADLELKAYVESLRKSIQNFRGYLQTLAL